MAGIVSVNVSCDNLHSDPVWQQRDILSVERMNDGSYRFSNWYTEIPNEFHLYHERFPENAFCTTVEIIHKLENETNDGEKNSSNTSWNFRVAYDDGSEKNSCYSIGNEYKGDGWLLRKYMDFSEFLGDYNSKPPERLQGTFWRQCWCSDFTISVVRDICRKKEVGLYTLYDMVLWDTYDDSDGYYNAMIEVTDDEARIFDDWCDGYPHKKPLLLDADGYIKDPSRIPLMTILQKNNVRVIHSFSKGLYML